MQEPLPAPAKGRKKTMMNRHFPVGRLIQHGPEIIVSSTMKCEGARVYPAHLALFLLLRLAG
jgi:hypothetical protein